MSRFEAAQILNRLNNAPVMIAAGREQDFLMSMQELRGVSMSREQEREMISVRRGELAGMYGYSGALPDKPFCFVDGMAIIPIHGTLINRFNSSWGFATGYNFIRAQMNAALDDPDVELLAYDVNSYGGECAGCFEAATEIRASRDRKPSIAVIDSNCMSAAYALASACTKMVCTPSGSVGSIGVMSMHTDISKALADEGYKITLIYSGAHKVDGNSFEALPAEVKADIKASCDKRYGEFVDLVVLNRGLDSQAVTETEAQQYRADDALALGLIDAVQTPTEAVASFLAEIGADDPDNTEDQEKDTMFTPDQVKEWQESAEGKAFLANAISTATATATTAERQRMDAVLGCEEAKDKQGLARHLASSTDMSVEQIQATLKVASPEKAAALTPEQQADADAKTLDQGMKNTGGGADLGPGPEGGEGAGKPSRAQRAMATAGVGGKHTSSSLIPRIPRK